MNRPVLCLLAYLLAYLLASTSTVRSEEETAESRQQCTALFEKIGQALSDENSEKALELFDAAGTLERCKERGIEVEQERVAAVTARFQKAVLAVLKSKASFMAWKRFRIERWHTSSGGKYTVLALMHTDADGVDFHLRWWLRRGPDGLRVVDFEEADLGLRLSTIIAGLASEGLQDALSFADFSRRARSIAGHIYDDEPGKALDGLDGLEDPPKSLVPFLLTLRAQALMDLGRPEGALEACEQARAAKGDAAVLDRVESEARLEIGEPRAAIRAISRYRDRVGEEAEGLLLQGNAALEVGENSLAMDSFRSVLSRDPGNAEALLGLVRAFAPESKRSISVYVTKLDDAESDLGYVARRLIDLDDEESLEVVVSMLRTVSRDKRLVKYYSAQLLALQERYVEAADLLAEHLYDDDLEDPQGYVVDWLELMHAARASLRAYREAPDREFAFLVLYAWLAAEEDARTLLRIAELHEKSNPEMYQVPGAKGEAYLLLGSYAKADEAFQSAIRLAKEDEDRDDYISLRAEAWARDGRAVAFYREKPDRERFERVAEVLYFLRDADSMTQLVAQRRESNTDEASVPMWSAVAEYLRGRYGSALSILAKSRASILADEYYTAWNSEIEIRCLVRTRSFEKALSVAKRLHAIDDCDLYFAMIHCARGAAKAAAKSIRSCLAEGHEVEELANDVDFEPFLTLPALARVRSRFGIQPRIPSPR